MSIEQEPEAWIIVNKETGYRTQVSDLTPFLYNRELFEVIPLYTAPPKREQTEQEPVNFDLERMKQAVESPVSDITVEGLTAKVKSNREQEQEQEVLKKDWVNFGYTAGRKEGYKRGYAIAREDFKQKVINAFGVDDE